MPGFQRDHARRNASKGLVMLDFSAEEGLCAQRLCVDPAVAARTGGSAHYSPLEMIVGPCLPHSGDPLLPGYAAWRRHVWADKLAGLRTAREPDTQEIARVEAILEAYTHMMKEEASC